MTDDLRDHLKAALDSAVRPPMGGVVEAATRRGRRTRRVRHASSGAGVLTIVGVVAGAAVFLSHGTAPVQPVATAGQPEPVASSSSLPVTATQAGMAQLLSELIPAGTGLSYGKSADGSLMVGVHLATAHGTGMIRVSMIDSSVTPSPATNVTRETAPNGDPVYVISNPANCIEGHDVWVYHPDGTLVDVLLSTCLDSHDGVNPASPQAMSVPQAIALASDSRWTLQMSPALAHAEDRTNYTFN